MSEIVDIEVKRYPLAHTQDGMILLTVLVKRIEGKFKAYAAIVPDVSLTDPDYISVRGWTKTNGNPLREPEASLIWPHVKGSYAI